MIKVVYWYIMELIKSHEMEGDTITMNVALLKYYIGLRGMNLTQFAALLGVIEVLSMLNCENQIVSRVLTLN